MNTYQEFIHKSRYARWDDEKGRRETFSETVERFVTFIKSHCDERGYSLTQKDLQQIKSSISNLEVLPSMRALMTAGKALATDNVAGFNCSFLPINHQRCFDELMYILMCFHPSTEVVTSEGNKKIKDLLIGDKVLSFNENDKSFVWQDVINVVENPTANKEKIKLTFEDCSEVMCTSDHKFLTDKGWVEAKDLTEDHDVVSPKFFIYRLLNKETGKSYIGYTGFSAEKRFNTHFTQAFIKSSQAYNTHLSKSIRKYETRDVWQVETVDFAYSKQEAVLKEQQWIKAFNTKAEGYNLTDGGEGTYGYKWTEEQKRKASENAYVRSDEHRAVLSERIKKSHVKISEVRKTAKYRNEQRQRNLGANNPMFGKHLTGERKEQLRTMSLGDKNPFYGKSHTEETKKILSEKAKSRVQSKGVNFSGKTHNQESLEAMKRYWECFKQTDKTLSVSDRHKLAKSSYKGLSEVLECV